VHGRGVDGQDDVRREAQVILGRDRRDGGRTRSTRTSRRIPPPSLPTLALGRARESGSRSVRHELVGSGIARVSVVAHCSPAGRDNTGWLAEPVRQDLCLRVVQSASTTHPGPTRHRRRSDDRDRGRTGGDWVRRSRWGSAAGSTAKTANVPWPDSGRATLPPEACAVAHGTHHAGTGYLFDQEAEIGPRGIVDVLGQHVRLATGDRDRVIVSSLGKSPRCRISRRAPQRSGKNRRGRCCRRRSSPRRACRDHRLSRSAAQRELRRRSAL
jgi:hypothetical protein